MVLRAAFVCCAVRPPTGVFGSGRGTIAAMGGQLRGPAHQCLGEAATEWRAELSLSVFCILINCSRPLSALPNPYLLQEG